MKVLCLRKRSRGSVRGRSVPTSTFTTWAAGPAVHRALWLAKGWPNCLWRSVSGAPWGRVCSGISSELKGREKQVLESRRVIWTMGLLLPLLMTVAAQHSRPSIFDLGDHQLGRDPSFTMVNIYHTILCWCFLPLSYTLFAIHFGALLD